MVSGSEQGSSIREVGSEQKASLSEVKAAVEEKGAAGKVVPVEELEPCMVLELRPGGVPGWDEAVAGPAVVADAPGALADVEIKTWLVAGGVVLLVIIGAAVLSTRKVTID